jgi:hypothetical protein
MAGCGRIPADPDKSFDRAAERGIIAGYTVNPPWVIYDSGAVSGIEVEILKSFTNEYNFHLVWVSGSEQKLMKMLENKEIQFIIGGFTSETPWKKKKAGFTRPYFENDKEKHIIAVQQGENKLLFHFEKRLLQNKDSLDTTIEKRLYGKKGSSLKVGERIETKSNLQTEIRRFLTTLAFRSE